MWAHAEFIKLLRSVRDQRVFDRIAPVADRYLEHKGRKDLEVWKSTRRVREIAAGKVLRILLAGEFRLRWSLDEGRTGQESVSTATGLGLGFVDIPAQKQQGGRVQFTFTKASATDLEQQVFEVKIGQEKAIGK
jgi:glucoamylase